MGLSEGTWPLPGANIRSWRCFRLLETNRMNWSLTHRDSGEDPAGKKIRVSKPTPMLWLRNLGTYIVVLLQVICSFRPIYVQFRASRASRTLCRYLQDRYIHGTISPSYSTFLYPIVCLKKYGQVAQFTFEQCNSPYNQTNTTYLHPLRPVTCRPFQNYRHLQWDIMS